MKKTFVICVALFIFRHHFKQDQMKIGKVGDDEKKQMTTMALKKKRIAKDEEKNLSAALAILKTKISENFFDQNFRGKLNTKELGLLHSFIFEKRKEFNSSRYNRFGNLGELNTQLKPRKRRSALLYSVPLVTEVCPSPRLSCKGRCMNERDARGMQNLRCLCDPYCDYFKDCCADYVQYCLGQQRSSMKVPAEQWTCRSGIWMIASCPHSWTNQDINQSCISTRSMTADNYRDVLPVVTADNKTYANRFCALCHGQSMKTITGLYELDFECLVSPPSKATEEKKMKFLFEFCQYPLLKRKDRLPKRYCITSKAKCLDLSLPNEIQHKCSIGNYSLVFEVFSYVALYEFSCCNNNGAITMYCGTTEMSIDLNFEAWSAKSFSFVMDIGGEQSKADESSRISSCPRGKVYDIYLEVCRTGEDVAPLQSNLKIYKVALWMTVMGPDYKLPPSHTLVDSRLFLDNAKFRKYFTAAFGLTPTSITLDLIDWLKNVYKVEFNIDITNYNKTQFNPKSNITMLFEAFKPFELQVDYGTYTVMKATSKPLTCVQIDTYSTHEYQVIPGTEASVYINTTGEVLGVRDYFPTNLTIIKGKQVPVGQIVVCRQMPSANCSGIYIFLQKHEYTIFPNRSVLYKASGRLYEHGTYTWKNGTIMICTNFTESYQQRSQPVSGDDHKALTILTYIGFCISVACLLFVLVTYSIFADLRTIPGINLMNLCSALLVAQILWLVGSGLTFTHLGCMVIAIILHYSFLVSFGWMSIIAFNIWRAFSGQASTRNYRTEKGQKRRHIARTMAVGWLPLIMYVSICVALDRSGTVAFGYGGEKGCWINNPRANLLFFAAPVGLSIVWNTVFFVPTIIEIKKAIDQSQMAASQHRARQDSTVYARIAVLMGFTWVFGFVAPFTSYYLMYPFVVLNTLQGLYIAVAFGFTRRVLLLYKTSTPERSKMANTKKIRETKL